MAVQGDREYTEVNSYYILIDDPAEYVKISGCSMFSKAICASVFGAESLAPSGSGWHRTYPSTKSSRKACLKSLISSLARAGSKSVTSKVRKNPPSLFEVKMRPGGVNAANGLAGDLLLAYPWAKLWKTQFCCSAFGIDVPGRARRILSDYRFDDLEPRLGY